MSPVTIRDATSDDLPAILDITNDAIARTDALWLDHPLTLEARGKWYKERTGSGFPVFAAVEPKTERVIGFGSYGPFRAYEGYAATVEHSLYVSPDAQGRGAGGALLQALVTHATGVGFHVMVAAITAGNEPSIALHRKHAFIEGGTLPGVGRKNGRWLDLLLMYRLLTPDNPADTRPS